MLKNKTFHFFHQHKYVFGNVLKIHKYMPFVDMWLIYIFKSLEGPLCEENLGNGSYRWVAHMIVKTLGMGATDGSRTWLWKPWKRELQMGRAHDCENLGNGSYRWVAHMIVKTLGMGATDGSRTWSWKPWEWELQMWRAHDCQNLGFYLPAPWNLLAEREAGR
jgi:protein involved in temperature-dependent protein secretion